MYDNNFVDLSLLSSQISRKLNLGSMNDPELNSPSTCWRCYQDFDLHSQSPFRWIGFLGFSASGRLLQLREGARSRVSLKTTTRFLTRSHRYFLSLVPPITQTRRKKSSMIMAKELDEEKHMLSAGHDELRNEEPTTSRRPEISGPITFPPPPDYPGNNNNNDNSTCPDEENDGKPTPCPLERRIKSADFYTTMRWLDSLVVTGLSIYIASRGTAHQTAWITFPFSLFCLGVVSTQAVPNMTKKGGKKTDQPTKRPSSISHSYSGTASPQKIPTNQHQHQQEQETPTPMTTTPTPSPSPDPLPNIPRTNLAGVPNTSPASPTNESSTVCSPPDRTACFSWLQTCSGWVCSRGVLRSLC